MTAAAFEAVSVPPNQTYFEKLPYKFTLIPPLVMRLAIIRACLRSTSQVFSDFFLDLDFSLFC